MQQKYNHEDIVNIQNALWVLYKDFLADKDLSRYKDRADALVNEYEGQMKVFAYNLVSVWLPVIDGFAEDFRDGRDTELREAEIKYIQNDVWMMYKQFCSLRSVKEYTRNAGSLAYKFSGRKICSYCVDLILAWVPVINGLAEEFRRGVKWRADDGK